MKSKSHRIFKDNLGKIQCAVCPRCSYTEMYLQGYNKIDYVEIIRYMELVKLCMRIEKREK